MISLFIHKIFDSKFRKLPKETKTKIIKVLDKIDKGNSSRIKKIPSSDLYVEKVGEYVLILSKKRNHLLAMDIMSKKQFSEEFRKSILFF